MLKFLIQKDALNEAISHVSRAISSRTTIPILSGIKVDASHQGVVLTASDTDISIQSFIPLEQKNKVIVQLQQPGSVVLPAKFFVDIVKKLPSQDIEIETGQGFQTTIRSGSSEIQIVGLDPEEYPLLPQLQENHVISLPSDILKTMIRQTVFAVSANETTPVLTGILWKFSEGKLKFVATDRHRLASRETALQQEVPTSFQNVVIAGKTMNELNKILPDENIQIEIIVAESQVLFKIESILFFTRILDGTYPDTSKIIPQAYKTELVLNTKQLTEAIDRAYLLSREEKTNIVRLVTKEDESVEISSSSNELGKVTEQIQTGSMVGEELKISFNSKYMLDALKIIDSENIQIGFTGAMSPIIIKPQESTNMLHLILPYRTVN
jgi:DNA polymerase-3 subunit beta